LFNGDEEALEDFIECLNPKELSIIQRIQDGDADQLRVFVMQIQQDVDETAKSLAM
jgi:hypothetical protein